jgi:hypothetical protein
MDFLDKDEIHMEILGLDKIYNISILKFFIWTS